MFENGDIDFETMAENVTCIRKLNYEKDRCNFCHRRIIPHNMTNHQDYNCKVADEYRTFIRFRHLGVRYTLCRRYEIIQKLRFKNKEQFEEKRIKFEEKKNKIFEKTLEEERNRINPGRSKEDLPPISIRKDPEHYVPIALQERMDIEMDYEIVRGKRKLPTLSDEEFRKEYHKSLWKREHERLRGFKLFQRPGFIYEHEDKRKDKQITIVNTSLDGSNGVFRHVTITENDRKHWESI
jgi:hypothetical protein